MAKKPNSGGMTLAELSSMPVEWILKNIAFLVFLGFLGVVYIGNSHYAEGNIRTIQELQKEIKELRWYYMSLESENMVNSMQSEVEEKIADEGLKLKRGKVHKIVVE